MILMNLLLCIIMFLPWMNQDTISFLNYLLFFFRDPSFKSMMQIL